MEAPSNLIRGMIPLGLIALLIFGMVFWLAKKPAPAVAPTNNLSPGVSNNTLKSINSAIASQTPSSPPLTTNTAAVNWPGRLPVPQFSWFQVHPFKAAQTNGEFEWTAEDGKDTNIIRQLAHNELEFQRMVSENPTIYRRQLVYHLEGFTLLAQQALQSGQGVQQITLPGLDGHELHVTVTKTDFESGGDRGLFYGQLPGETDSLVTAAFINGREAFTVASPQEHLFLQGESREPGELVVKSIDPNTYGGKGD
jgi:hypothetical protein